MHLVSSTAARQIIRSRKAATWMASKYCLPQATAHASAATTLATRHAAPCAYHFEGSTALPVWNSLSRQFHASSHQLSMRRRRRSLDMDLVVARDDEHTEESENRTESTGAVMEEEESPAVLDPEEFSKQSKSFLQKIYDALKPLQSSNDIFFLTKGIEAGVGEFLLLDVGPQFGQYSIQIDEEQCLLILLSPISGQRAYFLSRKTGDWLSVEDGHNFTGLLVRDLIRQINGVPNL